MPLAAAKEDILDDSDGYLADDTLRLLCHIDAQSIGAETADDPSRKRQQYEDVTLVVGGRRIYVNKGEERELPDVDPDDFETFKAVIYPTQKALDEDNIYAVVSLADRFVAKSLLEKCEEFMLEQLDPADAFKGLSQYIGLDDLNEK
ncbi:Protein BATH-25 [Aphelenchoides avenae]|nr:Protein BATH-25 [Aphelenchus avenae]